MPDRWSKLLLSDRDERNEIVGAAREGLSVGLPGRQEKEHPDSSHHRPRDNTEGESSTNFTYNEVLSYWMWTFASFCGTDGATRGLDLQVLFRLPCGLLFQQRARTSLKKLQGSTTFDKLHPVLRLSDRFWAWMHSLLRSESSPWRTSFCARLRGPHSFLVELLVAFPQIASCLIFWLLSPVSIQKPSNRRGLDLLPFTFVFHVATGVRILEASDSHLVHCPLDCLLWSCCLMR